MTAPKIDPATRARLDQMRRDRRAERISAAIFWANCFGGLASVLLAVWVVTR